MLQQKFNVLQKSVQSSFEETIDKTIHRAVVTSVNKSLDFLYSKAFYLVTNKLTLSLSFDDYYISDEDLNSVFLVIEKLSPRKFKEHIYRQPNDKSRQKFLKLNTTYIINLSKIQSYIMVSTNSSSPVSTGPADHVNIYFFGKQKKRAYRMFINTLNKYTATSLVPESSPKAKNSSNTIIVTTVNSIDWDTSYISVKNELQLCYEDSIKETILSYLSDWNNAMNLFKKFGLTYKTGILLYGEPGTGKTSLAKMIAYHFNFRLIIVDLKTFSQSTIKLIKAWVKSNNLNNIVVLMEDIDCIFSNRSALKTSEEKAQAQLLLQFLDGASSIGNVIYIATTNHIEALDPALIRDGRFDIKQELKPFCRDTAVQMCQTMYIRDQETINELLEGERFPINPAYLQNKILKYIFNHAEDFQNIVKEEEEKENESTGTSEELVYRAIP